MGTTNTILLIFLSIILAVIWICQCVTDYKDAINRKNRKYSLKLLVRHFQMIIGLIIAVYYILISVDLLCVYNIHIATTWSPSSLVYKTVPMACATFIILGMLGIFYVGFKPLWKFTDDEKVYRKLQQQQKKDLFDKKLQTYPKIIRLFLRY